MEHRSYGFMQKAIQWFFVSEKQLTVWGFCKYEDLGSS